MKEEKKIRKKIKIEDLLPRNPIQVDLDAILGYVKSFRRHFRQTDTILIQLGVRLAIWHSAPKTGLRDPSAAVPIGIAVTGAFLFLAAGRSERRKE